MAYQVGHLVWIPCEVKPGPFSDERIAKIHSDSADWVGFVPVHSLRDPITEGRTYVRAVITALSDRRFVAKIAGEPVASSTFEGTLSRVEPIAALQA